MIAEPYFVCVKNCPTAADPAINCLMDPRMTPKLCTDLQPSYPTQQIVTYCLPVDQTVTAGSKLVTDILSVGVLQ